MIAIVAVDDNLGMMFNNRRQSKDVYLREHIIKMCENSTLWINDFTVKQFNTPLPSNIIVDNELMNNAGDDDYCFIENINLYDYKHKINQLIIFKWNTTYPYDVQLDIPLHEWKLISTDEFQGFSHKLITKEVWIKDEK